MAPLIENTLYALKIINGGLLDGSNDVNMQNQPQMNISPIVGASVPSESDVDFFWQTPVMSRAQPTRIYPPKPSSNNKPTAAPALHNDSKTWKSEAAKRKDKHIRQANLINHFAKASPFVPKTQLEWLEHETEFAKLDISRAEKAVEVRNARNKTEEKTEIGKAFGGKNFDENRSAVLALPSIWTETYKPTINRPQASWPELAEFRHEGDHRIQPPGKQIGKDFVPRDKPGVPRCMPLARTPSQSIPWKFRDTVPLQYGLDNIGIINEHGRLDPKRLLPAETLEGDDDERERLDELLGEELMEACEQGSWKVIGEKLLEEDKEEED